MEMACAFAGRSDAAVDYLAGHLSDSERDAFETHLFECDECLKRVRLAETLRHELQREAPQQAAASPARRRPLTWLLAAAAVVLAAAGGLWMARRSGSTPQPARRSIASAATAGPRAPARSASTAATAPAPTPAPALLALARIEPPAFLSLTRRGPSMPFDTAMARYAAGDYEAAARQLRPLIATAADRAPVRFFLGVSLLMTAQGAAPRPDALHEGIDELRQTIALGDTPYRGTARLLLAKALIRAGDLDAAADQLEQTIAMGGDAGADAQALADRLRSARAPQR
jgi:hypothetical protein